jgi:hypothetical protein
VSCAITVLLEGLIEFFLYFLVAVEEQMKGPGSLFLDTSVGQPNHP